MSFLLYLLFIVTAYLQPADAFFPGLAAYRPMVILGLAALISALFGALGGIASAAKSVPSGLMLALLACIAVSQIANGWAGGALEALTNFSPAAFLFFLTLLNVTSLRKLKITLGIIVAATVIISVEGIAAYHYGFMADRLIMQQRIDDEENNLPADQINLTADDSSEHFLRRVRSLGFLNDPNDLAQAIILALPMLLIWHRKKQSFKNTLFLGVLGALFLYTIFLTHSRGALLGIGLLFFFGIRRRLGTVKTGVLLGILVAAAIAIGLAGGRGFSMQEDSAGNRILAWSEGISMLKQSPLIGVGYGNFLDYHEITAHNSFVLAFAELGLIGCYVWLALIVTAFQDVNRVTHVSMSRFDVKHYGEILRASLLGFLACAFFLSRTYAPLLFLLLALCIVLRYLGGSDEKDVMSTRVRSWVFPTIYVLAGGIAIIYSVVRLKHFIG